MGNALPRSAAARLVRSAGSARSGSGGTLGDEPEGRGRIGLIQEQRLGEARDASHQLVAGPFHAVGREGVPPRLAQDPGVHTANPEVNEDERRGATDDAVADPQPRGVESALLEPCSQLEQRIQPALVAREHQPVAVPRLESRLHVAEYSERRSATVGSPVKDVSDHLIRALAFGGRARALAAVTTGAVEELRRIHDPSPVVAAALGRVATGSVLLAATLEKTTHREPVLTLEINGSGPAGRFIATASPRGWLRAIVADATAAAPVRPDGRPDVAAVVGLPGELVVTRDIGVGQPYRGVVPLATGEIAGDLARYMSESEQTPAAVVLGVRLDDAGRVAHAGGYAVQLLPGVSDDEAKGLEQRVRGIGGVTESLAAGSGPVDWLAALFPVGFTVIGTTPVAFRCGCSMERVEQVLRLLGADEVRGLVGAAGSPPAELICGFCHASYVVPRDRLASILLEFEDVGAGPPS